MTGDYKLNDWTRTILSVVAVALVGGVLSALFLRTIPNANRDAVMLVLGALLLRLSDVYAYHFNTTASSTIKDKIIRTQAETTQTAQNALAPLETPDDAIVLKPGQQATATATFAGTVIEPKP